MHVRFLEDLMLPMVKGFMHMRTVEFVWLQRLTYNLCLLTYFPIKEGLY
jgi:hypothetical protein